ncbi:hypothetical protein TELCIR_19085, partial [Teladorsagia circumcincta]
MNNKPKNGTKASPYKHEQVRLDHRHRPDEGDIYERYSAPYHNDELHDRYDRRQERPREFRERRSPDERYDKIGNPSGMHVARIEIANETEDRWDHRKAEQTTSKTRNQPNSERRDSAPPSSKRTQGASKIPPPPPCMENFEVIDGYRSSLNHSSTNQQRQSEPHKENAPKCRTRDESHHNVDPPVERSRYPNTKASAGSNERRSPSRERSNKMVAANMANGANGPAQRPTELRIPAQRPTDQRIPTQRTVPTNQFLNVPERKHQNGRATPQQIKNVQEVVQKMNSGEWPTMINQEIVEVKIEVPPIQRNRNQREEVVDKAKNWETLPRIMHYIYLSSHPIISNFRSGRFVKKSAAALIAKKQGFSSQHCLEQPSSSEIVDPRIASEIRALREREEEFRRSRTELGLPTLDDVMN